MKTCILALWTASLQGLAMGQDFQCAQIDGRLWECIRQERHPSGPTSTRELRRGVDAPPYFREMQGARSGAYLMGDVRLQYNTDRSWSVVWADGRSSTLLHQGEQPPKWVRGVVTAGAVWDIYVMRNIVPVERAGIATEDEPKLDIQLVRDRNL